MLRRSLLYLSEQPWLRRWAETSAVAKKMTSRFVAGATLADGVLAAKALSGEGVWSTLDCLGENVSSIADAAASRNSYLEALSEIERAQLPATVSIKLTQFGLDLSEDACLENVLTLTERASQMQSRVEVDMESSVHTDRTLSVVRKLQAKFPRHVRAVIQAYLFRSEDDIKALSALGVPIRLCKGAYRESQNVAFASKQAVDENYQRLTKLLLSSGTYPAIATHDEQMVRSALQIVREQKIARDRFEFQMLYGIRRDLQRELVRDGFRLRLYVPYGVAWYPYFMRRLAERPANVLFLLRNLLRR